MHGPMRRPIDHWRWLYGDAKDPARFRGWLTRILDPAHRAELGHWFSGSIVTPVAGLMTFRYLRLHTLDEVVITPGKPLEDAQAIRRFDAQHNIVDMMIRNESLAEGVEEALDRAGYKLEKPQRKELRKQATGRINASNTHRPASIMTRQRSTWSLNMKRL